MASWFTRLFQSAEYNEVKPRHRKQSEQQVGSIASLDLGLDVNAAINAHMAWKKRLDDLLASQNGRDALDPLHVCRDDQCEPGKWIHGEVAIMLSESEEYHRLRAAHADFHQAAAKVITLVQSGRDDEARESLTTGEFARNSSRVKTELSRMYLDLGSSG
ncbi:CZB domain-containing protein [Sulfuriferula nivalis]|uniref:Chemoreceptor zinc-binding domain-containing protein n=1 Tax=Sulfuriferula nivalis TaxID=2675298 RepID=A0A809SFA4_9PROT|nr:CZB domain-containing protein [Sulfuriferula nivalis]BBP02097.1 hypothetical protein SFSGTM_28050 [Sulfuriferula nivalis]